MASTLADSSETGSLGICHLKRVWSSVIAARSGVQVARDDEAQRDRLVLDALGLGLHQTLEYLFSVGPTFAAFEEWVVSTAGVPEATRVERLNSELMGTPHAEAVRQWLDTINSCAPVLADDEVSGWEQEGYVVLKHAVDPAALARAERSIWDHIGADPDSRESWYSPDRQGVMVELIQDAAFEANRRAQRIHKAFAQLWGTADLWVSADRCGFHPPQRDGCPFPGPDLHWDVNLARPVPFGTQGVLYLTDPPPEQGALTLVPRFHNRLPAWLADLGPGVDPQKQDLHALGSVPVGGAAGDLVIWHQALPHGSRPNLGERPRIVQYINMYPGSYRGAD